MTRLPEDTFLGELELAEVFVFFDAPRVFSCQRLAGQKYVAEWVGELDDGDGDEWLYVPVSVDRLAQIRSGGIALRQAFTDPEDQLFHVVTYYDGKPDTARLVNPVGIDDDWLPAPDFFLELPTSTLPPAVSPQELTRRALAESRTRLRVELDRRDRFRSEASTKDVASLLLQLQHLLDNVGFSIDHGDQVYSKGPIPGAVSKQMESEVVELSAASFVIELAASTYDDLFGESLFAKATDRVLDLLDVDLDREQIAEKVSSLGPRAAKSFRKFIDTVSATESKVEIATASRSIGFKNRALSEERIAFLSHILNNIVPDEEISIINGEMQLYAYDSFDHTFGLRDDEGNKYEGRVEEAAKAHIVRPTIDRRYKVILAAAAVLDEVIGETTVRYRLRQLTPLKSDTESV
jgi:hypothetical protein